MTAVRYDLRTQTPVIGSLCYFDTSTLFPLAMTKRGSRSATALARSTAVDGLVGRMKKSGAHACSSVLALEEIAAKVRRDERRSSAQANGCASWEALERANPVLAKSEDTRIRATMISVVQAANDEAGRLGILFLQPQVPIPAVSSAQPVPKGSAAEDGKRVRKAWAALLSKAPTLDPMDALHIITGQLLLVGSFATFDQGWAAVPNIAVFVG